MSEFSVSQQAVNDAATRVSAISPTFDDLISTVGGHSGAAEGTSASGPLDELVSRWTSTLPHFAASAQSLSTALGNAAAGYEGTDNAVAGAAASDDPAG